MCGIAGFAGPESPESMRESVECMVDALARRGPDSHGMESWDGAVLGHRRLAILDLSPAGRQPMMSDDGQIGIVFNGCIYNFLEIKEELERRGHRFRSRCDTEVLIRGYQEWGVDRMMPRLRGMFAFGLWDNHTRTLTLARDRLGVKPLVYAIRRNSIGFASTVDALHWAGLVGDIAPQAVVEFLQFDWVSDEQSIFAGAHKVPAATIVEWRDGRVSERRYWTLPEAGSRNISFDEAVEQTEAILLDAARLRLISDVPLGALLSGGIDSGLICWAMSKAGANIKAFTVSTPGDPADETEAARATARTLGIPHEIVELPPDAQPAFEDLIDAYSEPFACGSALAMLRVCKAVKPKATVLLTGDGGDDVFLGYPPHRTFQVAQQIARLLPGSAARAAQALRPAFGKISLLRRASRLVDYATGGMGAVLEAHDGLAYFERWPILGERLRDADLQYRQVPRSVDSARNLMAEFFAYHFRNRFTAEFMTKVDGGAMHYAVEARSPFLDQTLWEFAASLPFDLRLRGGELKAVLRALARKNIGPAIASRRKQGFTVPVDRWLAGRWKSHLEDAASGAMLEQEGWIRPGTFRAAADEAIQAGRVPRQLWSLLVFEHWIRKNVRQTVASR